MTALRGRDYRALLLAGLVSEIGDWLLLIALPILVYQLTGSTLGTALAFLVELLPPMLSARWPAGSPTGGTGAAHWSWSLSSRQRPPAVARRPQPGRPLDHLRGDRCPGGAVPFAGRGTRSTGAHPGRRPRRRRTRWSSSHQRRQAGRRAGRRMLLAPAGCRHRRVDALRLAWWPLLVPRIAATASPRGRRTAPAAGEAAGNARAPRPCMAALTATARACSWCCLCCSWPVSWAAARRRSGCCAASRRRLDRRGAVARRHLAQPRPATVLAVGAGGFGRSSSAIWNGPLVTTGLPYYLSLFALVGAPAVVMVTGLVSLLQGTATDAGRGRVFGVFGAVYEGGSAVGMLLAGLLGDRLGVVAVLNLQAVLAFAIAALAGAALRRRPALAARPPRRSPARPSGVRWVSRTVLSPALSVTSARTWRHVSQPVFGIADHLRARRR